MKFPRRIAQCKHCGHRFDVDSDVLLFLGLGILLGILLSLMLCSPAHAQEPPHCDCATICEHVPAAGRCHVEGCKPQERRAFTVPFHSVNGLILLDGQLNGKPAVFLLDTGANNSVVDYRAAGLPNPKLDALRSTGSAGAEGTCIVREVKLSLEHRSWLARRVCVMDLSDVSKRMETKIDGFIGADLLATFSAVRIDYKAQTITLEN